MPIKTGVIGLGAMGAGMAANLHRAGYLTCVWNRTAERGRLFAEDHDVSLAPDPAALAEACDLIITCVSADQDLFEVADAFLPGLRQGAIVVDTSTVKADTARRLSKLIDDAGGRFLDAPVSGGVEGARKGTLAMMVGGDAAVLDQARPALEAIAASIIHMGPVGSGQATKAVNQVMVAGINQAVTEALAFGAAAGLDLDRVIEVISKGAAGNWFLEHRGPTMIKEIFTPGFKVALHHKDLGICREMAAEKHCRLPVVEMTIDDYQRLLEAGYGDDDISSLYRIKRELFAGET